MDVLLNGTKTGDRGVSVMRRQQEGNKEAGTFH